MDAVVETTQPPAVKSWKEAFHLKADLRQKDVYAFEGALREQETKAPTLENVISRAFQVLRAVGMTIEANIESEHHLKAAIRAGWIESPLCEVAEVSLNGTGRKTVRFFVDGVNVDELHPGQVRWYGKQVQTAYNRAVEDPDPN